MTTTLTLEQATELLNRYTQLFDDLNKHNLITASYFKQIVALENTIRKQVRKLK